ncbi:hypothetical protein GCM10009416_50260 [Craurococcus roseus]|uniref:Uncharacterized protein n=1 Tax=Craurococcus roseus TaxID=77585 RepID=A0ABN1GAC5_9PROT
MESDRNEPARERAPLLRVFGVLAPRVADLIRARPALTARLVFAPREAVHAIGAYLHLAPGAAGPDEQVAALVDDRDPRELLRAALPGCPPRLYRALDRTGDAVRERAFYAKLGEVARGPFGGALLDGGARLDDQRLDYYRALARMDPVVGSLRGALPEALHHAEAVDALVAFLRARGALDEADFRLPPKAGPAAVARRLRRALGRVPAPDPGFAAPPPYRLVGTGAELQRIGEAFKNCVAPPQWQASQHLLRLLDGTGAYLTSGDPALLVALRRVAAGVWTLEQMAGPGNAAPPDGARSALLRDLAAAGLRMVAVEPAEALSRFDHEVLRERERLIEAGLGDPLEDDDLDGRREAA